MAIYAIKFGKWVEIREATTHPIKRESQKVIEVEEQVADPVYMTDPYWGQRIVSYNYKTVKKKKKFTSVNWDGGETLGIVAYERWYPTGVKNGLPKIENKNCVKITDKALADKLKTEYTRDLLLGEYRNNLQCVLENDQDDQEDDDYDDNWN